MQNHMVELIPDELYASIEASIPIVCADFILVRRSPDGAVAKLGLIERHSPYGRVWCHLGGRIRRGETVRAAIERHLSETLSGAVLHLVDDPQPQHVYQWFPPDVSPSTGLVHGTDSRKHAVGLTFVVDCQGEPTAVPGGEALAVAFFDPRDLPAPLWPGCRGLFDVLLADY